MNAREMAALIEKDLNVKMQEKDLKIDIDGTYSDIMVYGVGDIDDDVE